MQPVLPSDIKVLRSRSVPFRRISAVFLMFVGVSLVPHRILTLKLNTGSEEKNATRWRSRRFGAVEVLGGGNLFSHSEQIQRNVDVTCTIISFMWP